MAQYRVIGPVAVVRGENKSERYLYKGAVFSDAGADAENIKHLAKVKLIEKVAASSDSGDKDESKKSDKNDEGAYKGTNVADLKAEIDKRNEGREDDAKIVPAEPGNRPEIVAALIADDSKQ